MFQVFHLCADDGTNSGTNRKFDFLCPNGTLFDQVIYNIKVMKFCAWGYNIETLGNFGLWELV